MSKEGNEDTMNKYFKSNGLSLKTITRLKILERGFLSARFSNEKIHSHNMSRPDCLDSRCTNQQRNCVVCVFVQLEGVFGNIPQKAVKRGIIN